MRYLIPAVAALQALILLELALSLVIPPLVVAALVAATLVLAAVAAILALLARAAMAPEPWVPEGRLAWMIVTASVIGATHAAFSLAIIASHMAQVDANHDVRALEALTLAACLPATLTVFLGFGLDLPLTLLVNGASWGGLGAGAIWRLTRRRRRRTAGADRSSDPGPNPH